MTRFHNLISKEKPMCKRTSYLLFKNLIVFIIFFLHIFVPIVLKFTLKLIGSQQAEKVWSKVVLSEKWGSMFLDPVQGQIQHLRSGGHKTSNWLHMISLNCGVIPWLPCSLFHCQDTSNHLPPCFNERQLTLFPFDVHHLSPPAINAFSNQAYLSVY